jgi:UDP-glucose 4-epimerase
MHTILLTGGLGYIGSHIALQLLNSNDEYKVIIIDNLSNSSIDKLDIIKNNIENNKTDKNESLFFFQIDLINYNDLDKLFKEHHIDIVIHLAGLKSVGESISNPLFYYHNNLLTTINLLNIMEKYNCKNIIFSSSATVYGTLKAPYTEDMEVGHGLTNPYGKTKYMQEEFLRDLYNSDKSWNIIILRYFNPISHKNLELKEKPNGIPNNLFPYIVKVHYKELPLLNVYGNDYNTEDGTCVRDFIHVVDLAIGHVKACLYIINNKKIGIKTYNLGTGNGISVKKLIDKFEEVNNTKINHIYTNRRIGDLDISYANSNLAQEELQWKTQHNINDMVKL